MARRNRWALHPGKVGLSVGITFALAVFILGLAPVFFSDWGMFWVNALSTVYLGYNASFVGAIIGAVWAFFDGFIGGLIFAIIYNWVDKKVK